MQDQCKPGLNCDEYCDDINNKKDCNYDGGDCCGCNVNIKYCSYCQCLDPDGSGNRTACHQTTSGGTTQSQQDQCNAGMICDEYCDDINNKKDWNYDVADCCGSNVDNNTDQIANTFDTIGRRVLTTCP